MKNLLLVAALALSTQALAQRICIAPFAGPNGNAVRNQLVSTICDTLDCLNATKVTTGGKPDWKKAKKEALQYFVTGTVVKKGKKSTLTLQVLDKPGAPKLSKQFALEKDTLAAKNLASAVEALKGALGSAAPPVEPTKPPVDATRPPPPPPVDPVKPVKEPERIAEKPPEVVDSPAPRVKRRAGDYFLALDLGSDLYNRQFDYSQATTENLRRYDLTFFPVPRVGLEFYPLALGNRDDLLRGLGLEASLGLMPMLKTQRKSDSAIFPTSTMRIDGGLRWRLRFSKDVPFALVPFVGVRLHSFSVGVNTADGTPLDGVPNLNYVGLRAGLGAEFVAAEDLITIFGQFAVIPVFSSGEVISQNWFAGGSNLGLDGAAGVGVRLMSMLQLRATVIYTRYNLTFRTSPTDRYVAVGAFDQYLGGNVGVRLQF